jgi:hypothetical protein
MIKKLTKEQEAKLVEYRQKYFDQATSTERADRERAEVAARRLVELGGMKVKEIFWVDSPQEGEEKYDSLKGLLRESLWDSLVDSLWGSLWDSLKDSLGDSLKNSFLDSLGDSLKNSFLDSLRGSLWGSLEGSLKNSLKGALWSSLRDSLRSSLMESLWDSLRCSLRDSLWDSLWGPPRDSLRGSLWDSLWDTGSVAFITFLISELGIEVSAEKREKLNLINEILFSCFAIWVVPGTVILCDRPRSVDVQEGKLVNMEW